VVIRMEGVVVAKSIGGKEMKCLRCWWEIVRTA